MNKYDELCQTALAALADFREYKQQSQDFALKFVQGLKAYLGVPSGKIWAAYFDEPHSKVMRHPYSAIRLDEGSWKMAVVVRYDCPSTNERPLPEYIQEAYPVTFRRLKQGWHVQFADKMLKVHTDDDLQQCYQAYYDNLRSLPEEGLFGSGPTGGAKIGFGTTLAAPPADERKEPPI